MTATSRQSGVRLRKAWETPSLSRIGGAFKHRPRAAGRFIVRLTARLALCFGTAFAQTEGPLRPRRRPPPPENAGQAAAPLPPPPPSSAPRSRAHDDPLIRLARAANAAFTESLPDFVAERRVERFVSFNRGRIWALEDVVEAEVVYAQRKETYRNVRIDGRRHDAGMEDLGAAWSTGEYGTLLRNLFAPQLGLVFTRNRRRDDETPGAAAYAVQASREQSTWSIHFNEAHIRPAYRAAVWLAPESGRALRVEMTAEAELPPGFGLRLVKTTLRFASATVGGAQYLLPASAATLSCLRRSVKCYRHEIAFDNYRKFSAESSIFHVESDVSFGNGAAAQR